MRWIAALLMAGAAAALAGGDGPGRAVPAAPAPPGAWRVDWGGNDPHRSWIVVSASASTAVGRLRPAWVMTYEPAPNGEWLLSVAYPAVAYIGQDGALHIQARQPMGDPDRLREPRAILNGPRASSWWPDSFRIAADGAVQAQDQQPLGAVNLGTVSEQIDPAIQTDAYDRLRREAAALAYPGG